MIAKPLTTAAMVTTAPSTAILNVLTALKGRRFLLMVLMIQLFFKELIITFLAKISL